MAKIITKKKEVSFEVAVAYDGTEFSEEQFGSIDAAKAEADKYDATAESIVKQRAMKVLKPYVLPDKYRPLEEQADSVKEYCKKAYHYVRGLYESPQKLMIQCIASALYSDNWSCLSDICTAVYIFKPKTQEDIEHVTQYLNLIKAPCWPDTRDPKKYGDIGKILDKYALSSSVEQITPGKSYVLFVVPDNEATSIVDVHEWLSKVSAFVDDVDTRY